MKKLVVIAEKEELKLVEQLGYDKYPVLIMGVGATNVIENLKDIPRDTQIINIGFAGSKNLPVDKFYCVDRVSMNQTDLVYNNPVYTLAYCPWPADRINYDEPNDPIEPKTCYTSSDFVLKSNKENCLFDMELAYIKALGFEDVLAFKYVSDNLDLQDYRSKLGDQDEVIKNE